MVFKVPTSNNSPKENTAGAKPINVNVTPSNQEIPLEANINMVGKQSTQDQEFNNDIMAAAKTLYPSEPIGSIDTFHNDIADSAKMLEQSDPYYSVKVRAREEDPAQINNIFKLSEKTGKRPDDITNILLNTPSDEVEADHEIKDIVTSYPGLKLWLQKPGNYALFKKDPRYMKSLENDVNELVAYAGDAKRVMKQNYYTFEQMALHAAISDGHISIEEGADLMSKVQDKIDQDPFLNHREENISLQSAYKRMSSKIDKADKDIGKAFNQYDKNSAFKTAYDTAIALGVGAEGAMDMALELMKNPATASLWGLQSLNSAALPFTLGRVGAVVGSAAGPLGTAAGSFLGGSAGGYITAYYQFLMQESDKYRDPETNKVDFKKMYSDPKVVDRMKKLAQRYGGTQAIFAGLSEFLIGKRVANVAEALKKSAGKNIAKRALDVGKATALELSSEAALEATGEFASQKAAGATTKEATEQAVIEGLLSPVTTGTKMSATALINTAIASKDYSSAKKLNELKNKVRQATESMSKIKKMREDRKSSPVSSNDEQLKDFIKEVKDKVEERKGVPQEFTTLDASEEDIISTESKNIDNELKADQGKTSLDVQFDIDKFSITAIENGITPVELATKLGVLDAYNKVLINRETFIKVPIENYINNSDEHPYLDDIAHIGDNEYNSKEAQDILDEYNKKMQDLPSSYSPADGEGDITTDESKLEGAQFTFEEGTPEEGDPVFRPIVLLQKGRNQEEKKVYQNIRKALAKSQELSGQPVEVGDSMAEIQFRHIRFRSEVLGKSIKEVASETSIGHRKDLVQKERASGMFMPRWENGVPRSKILFSNSTKAHVIVHEFAHSWLFNMSEDWYYISGLENRTEAQEAYYQAMVTTAKLLNIDNVGLINKNGLHKSQYTKIHETFAQTAEKYMLEGDFSDSRLQTTFESMKKWMKDIGALVVGMAYKMYPALKISPEVNRVFQTILDGDERITDEMEDMFQEPLYDPNMFGAKAQKYKDTIREARDKAIAQMYAKFYNKSYKERETLINKSLKEINNQAEELVSQRPSMVLRDWVKQDPKYKITFESVVDILAGGDEAKAEEIRSKAAPGMIAGKKKAGVHLSEIMVNWNINDPKEMIALLEETAMKEELLEETANQLIEERFPILKTDSELHDIAVEAINAEGREKIIALELEKLAEDHLNTLQKMNRELVLPPSMVNKKYLATAKAEGLTQVMNATARHLKPDDFLKRSHTHAKDAANTLPSGDYEKAFYDKQKELNNFKAYQTAKQVRPIINTTLATMKRIMSIKNSEASKRYDIDIYGYLKAIIPNVDKTGIIPKLSNDILRNKLPEDIIYQVNSTIDDFNLSNNNDSMENMTVINFLKWAKIINQLSKIAIAQKKIEVATLKGDRDIIVRNIAEQIGPRKSTDPAKPISFVDAITLDVETLLSSMFETEEAWVQSDLYKVIQATKHAENRFQLESEQDANAIYEAVKKFAEARPKDVGFLEPILKRLDYFVRAGDEVRNPIMVPELNATLANEGNILQIMLYWGSESGREKLIFGGFRDIAKNLVLPNGYYDPFTKELHSPKMEKTIAEWMSDGTITKDHMDLLQVVWDAFDRHHSSVKEGIRKARGYDIGKISPKSIMTPWGEEYRGGYIPLDRDASDIDAGRALYDFNTDISGQYISELYPQADMSATKSRTAGYYPLSLEFSRLKYSLDNVYRMAYMMPTMYEVGKIMSHPDFKTLIELRRPEAMKQIIKPWFDRTMGQEYSVRGSNVWENRIDGAVRIFRNNVRVKYFLFGISSAMKQYLGILPAVTKIPASYIAKASLYVGIDAVKARNDIAIISPRMAHRFDYNAKNVLKSYQDFDLTFDYITKGKDMVQKGTFFLIAVTQTHVDTIIFNSAIEYGRKELNLKGEDAINYAADTVERTQGTQLVSARSNVQHGREVQRLITDFMNVPITYSRMIYETKTRSEGLPITERVARMTKALMLVALIPSIAGSIIGSSALIAKGLKREKEREALMKRVSMGALTDTLDINMPFSGRLVDAVVDNPVNLIPSLREVKVFKSPYTLANQMANNQEIGPREIADLLDAFTFVTGVPLSVASNTFKAITRYSPDVERKVKRMERRANRK